MKWFCGGRADNGCWVPVIDGTKLTAEWTTIAVPRSIRSAVDIIASIDFVITRVADIADPFDRQEKL